MWNKTEHHFPNTKEGTRLTTKFEYQGDKLILGIQPSCQCTTFELIDKTLHVEWKTAIRRQVRDASTFLTVEYQDGSIDDLTLSTRLEL